MIKALTRSYRLIYKARYKSHDYTTERVVNVVDTTPPEITLLSDPGYTPSWLDGYVEEGYTAHDAHDGDLTGAVRHQIHQQITAVHFLQQISNRGV